MWLVRFHERACLSTASHANHTVHVNLLHHCRVSDATNLQSVKNPESCLPASGQALDPGMTDAYLPIVASQDVKLAKWRYKECEREKGSLPNQGCPGTHPGGFRFSVN